MRIFRCVNTGCEVFCDENKAVPEEGCMYVVKGRKIEIGGEDYGIAANADEDADEGAAGESAESKKQKVIDVIHNNRLEETSFDKASFMGYIKVYVQGLMAKIKEKDEAYAAEFGKAAQAMVKKVAGNIDNWQFFFPDMGDNADYENGICILATFVSEDDDAPTFYFWKDGLKAEKV